MWIVSVLCACVLLMVGCRGPDTPGPAGDALEVEAGAVAGGVRLHALPEKMVRVCKREGRIHPLLCPAVFPRRTREAPVPLVAFGRDLFTPNAWGIDLGYSAPYHDYPRRNHPGGFMHLWSSRRG